jgi:signal transduction histidine kinase/CheY-like chemotaxis protein
MTSTAVQAGHLDEAPRPPAARRAEGERARRDRLVGGVLFVVAYAALALLTLRGGVLLGVDLSRLIWFPSGLALAFIVREGLRAWPWIFVGEALVTLIGNGVLVASLGTGAGSASEALLAAWLLQRIGFSPSLRDWRDVVALIVLGAGVSSIFGAFLSVGSLVSGGVYTVELFPVIWVRWWLTHANGILLLTPVLLTIGTGLRARIKRAPVEATLVGMLTVVAGSLLFWTDRSAGHAGLLLYLPFPPLIWAAFRYRLAGAAWANLFLAIPAILGTARGLGPLAGEGVTGTVVQTWVFLVVSILSSLVLAGVVANREEESERRVRAEAEQREMAEQVHQAQKLESLGVLAGGIAHDFNNLLASIMGNADLADRKLSVVHPASDHVAEVLRASRRAADLCRQILAYAGRGKISASAVDLREVVQEMGELLSVSFPMDAQVEFLESGEMLAVWGDVSQLRQVVLNLLTNAADALPDGKGRITVTTGTLDRGQIVRSDIVAGEIPRYGVPLVHLTVEDDGPGMTPEVRNRVFEPFYSTKDVGRGLGLAVVTGIVRSHGGCLELRTAPGEGAVFRMTLPTTRRRVERATTRDPLFEPLRFEGVALLADDEEAVRLMCRSMLEEAGLTVVTAEDGQEAMDRFRAMDDRPAVVILDVTMPRMNGFDTLQAIRSVDPQMPIILSSGNLQDEHAVESDWGVPLLSKPYSSDKLQAVLARVLRPVTPQPVASPAGDPE